MKHPWKFNPFILLLILCMLSCCVVGWIYARYVVDQNSNTEMEIIAEGKLDILVTEGTNHTYTVRNATTSNMPAYVRFAVVVNWVDSDGNVWPYSVQDAYTVNANQCCSKVGNYYYYNGICQPGDDGFTVSVEPKTTMIGYTLQVQILAEGIQIVPETAAKNAWGVTFDGDNWKPQ